MNPRSTGKIRVAVVSGGPSGEHDVSLASGRNVVTALPRDRFEVLSLVWRRDGRWTLLDADEGPPSLLDGWEAGTSPLEHLQAALGLLRRIEPSIVFLALHGRGGEDGLVQGLLELGDLPHTGSGVAASALAFDKRGSKLVFRSAGVPTPPHVEVRRSDLEPDSGKVLRHVVSTVGLPCFAKVSDSGSSIGAYPCSTRAELATALVMALEERPLCLVEPLLRGTEVTVGVLGNTGAIGRDAPMALPVTEIRPCSAPYFDYESKYTPGATLEITPARISEDVADRVRDLAVRAHTALGCDGATRTDLILTESGPAVLEVNTIPGLTETSLLPQGAAAAGIDFPALLVRMVELGLARSRRHRSETVRV